MYARLEKLVDQIRSGYWFVPAVMALGALLLAIVLVAIDVKLGDEWLESLPFFSPSRPQGARAILTAIGGSMIGVAGTVFSVMMAAVVYASGQYGPRLLTHFLSDRGNQFTLGTFTATFTYSMMVLRTIQSAGESGSSQAFVPNLALLVCILLALISIGVLIFFIHHVPTRIHISQVIAGIGRALIAAIPNRYPARVGEPGADEEDAAIEKQIPECFRDGFEDDGDEPGFAEIEADSTGYVQFLNELTLMLAARSHDLVVRLNIRPGDYIFPGTPAFDVWPAEKVDEQVEADLLSAIAAGDRRTPADDMLFLLDELVEIVARAMSPGVNDPSTSNTCLDWMAAVMAELAQRNMPAAFTLDDEDRLRIIASPLGFADYVRLSFGSARDYVAGDKIAASHFLHALGLVARSCTREDRLQALVSEADYLHVLSREKLSGHSLCEVEDRMKQFSAMIAHPRRRAPFPALREAAPEAGKKGKSAGKQAESRARSGSASRTKRQSSS
ncbi:MAG: DUF2254 domain-containing protein [Nitratireductor sp.]|nr:DUF2254 domain-containing protein [Nitratireductor sp.]